MSEDKEFSGFLDVFEGEDITCAYCGKTIKATQDMKEEWIKVSVVSFDESMPSFLVCSEECLKGYVNQSEEMEIERRHSHEKDQEWKEQEKRK